MGCAYGKAKLRANDNSDNWFKVFNIDKSGSSDSPGLIELTDDCIILHQKRQSKMCWPIRYLRNYGFDTTVFSFEAGRKCPTGEGIFAFRCENAETLFRKLQNNIKQLSGSNHERHFVSHILQSEDQMLVQLGDQNSSGRDDNSDNNSSSYVTFDLDAERPNLTPPEDQNNILVYIDDDDDQNIYANVPRKADDINYIEVELNDSKTSSSVHVDSSNGTHQKYTLIDFDKTTGLINASIPNALNDIGCTRRTRHNSRFDD